MTNKRPEDQTVDEWLVDWELAPNLPNASGKTDEQLDSEVAELMNMCTLSPQTPEAIKKENWYRLDCLTKHLLSTSKPNNELKAWFERQNNEWQASRTKRFTARLNQRRW